MAVYQVSFFAAVDDTGVAVGTVVALGSAPALAGGAAWLVDGERPGAGWAMATALAAAGVACLALASGGQTEISLAGVALALVAGAGYALMTLTSKRLLRGGREVELAREHAAARHSVRAALRTLAAERLVTLERHRGAHVAVLDGPAGRALYELRTGLEVEAARLALARHGGRLPAAVHRAADRLAAACARQNARWADVSRAHGGLHGAIVAAADSPRIADATPRWPPRRACLLLNVPRHWSLPALAEDHLRLVPGLETRGPEALREHLDASAALLLGTMRADGRDA